MAQPREIADLLDASPFAGPHRNGQPILVLGGDPARLVYANAAACALFGADEPTKLFATILTGDSQGAQRLRHLAASPPEGPPRFELLRFFAARMPLQIGLVCARLIDSRGETLLAAATPPLRARLLEEAAAPAVPQPEQDLPAAAPPHLAPVRFVWSSDADDRFASPSPALVERVGGHAPNVGETLAQLRARAAAARFDELVSAIAGRATFQSVRLLWPNAEGDRNLVATLSGSPLFDKQRQFAGFRGFGVFTGEFEPIAAPVKPMEAEPAPASAPKLERLIAEIAPERGDPDVPEVADEAPEQSALQPASERSAEIVTLRPGLASPPSRPNVVPIRPGSIRVLTSESPGRNNGGDSIALTTDERDAFREIAMALGARMRVREDKVIAPAQSDANENAPETGNRQRDLIDLGAEQGGSEPTSDSTAVAAAPDGAAIGAQDARQLLDTVPIGVLVTRGEEALYLNRTLLDLLGYRDIETFRQADGLAHMFKGREPEQATPAGIGGPLSLVAANGDLIAVDGQPQTIEWSGAPATLISLRRSLEAEYRSKLQALENEVSRHQAQTHEAFALLDKTSDGVVGIDRDGRILSLSHRAEALLGIEQREIIGENFARLLAAESREAAGACFESILGASPDAAVQPGLEVIARERRGHAPDLLMTLHPAGPARANEYYAVLRDLTATKSARRDSEKARAEAEKTSALKSDMLSAISHEIRTPLNAILGFTEVMREERFGPIGSDRYKQYINDIHLSGQHVLSLVNDLLDLSKIEAGKFELNFAPLDANRVIQECVALIQPHATRERIIVRLSLYDKLPLVFADERSLRQIVLNLLSNAVKFNEPGGQVIVSSALSEANQAVIRIRDTGIGMSENELTAALEPFRQVSKGRRAGGTGLGLPLTKALVEANKAGFSINSRKEQGTLVELTFPIAHAQAAQ